MAKKRTITAYTLDANESSAWIPTVKLFDTDEIGQRVVEPYILVKFAGTWDGATVSIEFADDDSGTNGATDTTSFTADDVAKITVSPGFYMRFTMSSAGTSDVKVSLPVYN